MVLFSLSYSEDRFVERRKGENTQREMCYYYYYYGTCITYQGYVEIRGYGLNRRFRDSFDHVNNNRVSRTDSFQRTVSESQFLLLWFIMSTSTRTTDARIWRYLYLERSFRFFDYRVRIVRRATAVWTDAVISIKRPRHDNKAVYL